MNVNNRSELKSQIYDAASFFKNFRSSELLVSILDCRERIFPDMVLLKGKIVTVNENDYIVEAVAVKDGHILASGTTTDIETLARKKTNVIDLDGKKVLPGFVDTPTHTPSSPPRPSSISTASPHQYANNSRNLEPRR